MHIQTILQSQVLFGHTRPALRPWLRKLWPPSRSAFKRRAIGRKRCGDGSNFRGERPGKHLGGFHDGWFIMENPMKISHVPKPLVVFGPKKYIYIIHIYLSIYTHTYFVPESQMFFDFQLDFGHCSRGNPPSFTWNAPGMGFVILTSLPVRGTIV